MCGIGCLLVDSNRTMLNGADGVTRSSIEDATKRRGPDSTQSTTTTEYDDWFTSSVLHIQGSDMVQQPFVDKIGNILAWNGEVFSGLTTFTPGISDTSQISALFDESIRSALSPFDFGDFSDLNVRVMMSLSALQAVTKSISNVNGPYAFIYYHKLLQMLIYGRDPLGRRSLLQFNCIGFPIALSSVWPSCSNDQSESGLRGGVSSNVRSSDRGANTCSLSSNDQDDVEENDCNNTDRVAAWIEIPITGLFGSMIWTEQVDSEVGLTSNLTCRRSKKIFVPWCPSRIKLSRICSRASDKRISRGKIEEGVDSDEIFATSSAQLLSALLSAVRCRVSSVGFKHPALVGKTETEDVAASSRKCRVGVLFSGGIDSVVLAALLHLCMDDALEPIDLLNVAFTGTGDATGDDQNTDVRTADSKNKTEAPAPDRLAAISALRELKILYPIRDWRLVHIDVTSEERNEHESRVKSLIQPRTTHMDLNIGTALWFASRGKGYLKEYSEEDMDNASGVRDAMGRPLVRAGGLGHAQSVGLSSWNARNKVQGSDGVGTEGQGPPLGLQCSNSECRRVGKRGCPRALCKRCCNKEDSYSNIGSNSSISSSISSSSSSSSVEAALVGGHANISNVQCRVHKSSAKELEKMEKKLKERRGQCQDPTAQTADSASKQDAVGVDVICQEAEVVEEIEPTTSGHLPSLTPSPQSRLPEEIPYTTSCRALLIGIGADEQMVRQSNSVEVLVK